MGSHRHLVALLLLAAVPAGGADLYRVGVKGEPGAGRRGIEAAGGRVSHVLPDGALVVLGAGAWTALPEVASVEPYLPHAGLGAAGEEPLMTLDRADTEDPEPGTAAALAPVTQSPVLLGDIVVGLVLPESTGAKEPGETDWTPADVAAVVDTVVAGTMRYVLAPGSPRITFILDLLSAPPDGGAPGTVACAYEAIRHSNFDSLVDASWLATLGYGGAVADARQALAQDLRAAHGADGAYFAKVINDVGLSPGRASALLYGPQVVWFRSSPPFVPAHETAHAFGALDEYCPDACRSPAQLSGNDLAPNANSRGNDGTGFLGGAGEGSACLMIGDTPRVCPHTRAQIGWSDADLDGIPDAADLFARSAIVGVEPGPYGLHVIGNAKVAALLGQSPVALDRIAGVEVRAARGAWMPATPADGTFDSASEEFSAWLPALPAGGYAIEARATTASGNVERRPARVAWKVEAGVADAAPFAVLAARPSRARSGSSVELDARASSDLEGGPLLARFDFDGDGAADTGWSGLLARHAYPAPGHYLARVEVMDLDGGISIATFPVEATAEDLPPVVRFTVHADGAYGSSTPHIAVDASASFDPEGGALRFEFDVAPGNARLGPGPGATAEQLVDVPLSESVAVTVKAWDGSGLLSEATRTVRVVAYDHPPVAALALSADADTGGMRLDAGASSDPDHPTIWDGWMATRFDFDGDGTFDTTIGTGLAAASPYAAEDTYDPEVEVRDRFLATARAQAVLDLRTPPVFPDGVGLAASASGCGVDLAWNPALAASGPVTYAVYRADTALPSSPWQPVAVAAATRFRDLAALPGHRYAYHVRAWAPGEPPLEDGNQETQVVTLPADTIVQVRLVKRDGGARIEWQPGYPASIWQSDAPGGEESLASVSSSGGSAEVAGDSPLTLWRVALGSCRNH